jgi:Na+/H+-dicarboxylate symporter
MRLAPLGAFGAIAFAIGKFGIDTLRSLLVLMACFYATCLIFVFVVLGSIARVHGFSIFRFVRYLRDELLIVLGTSSSESVLPRMLAKMENAGCARPVVSLVIPTGYSFNLDGSTLYLAVASIFVAQAAGIHLDLGQQLLMMLTLMLTSKGVAAVPRASLVILSGTLVTFGLPLEGVAVILGVDAFMDMARTSVNLVGNCLASAVMARWEGEFSPDALELGVYPVPAGAAAAVPE